MASTVTMQRGSRVYAPYLNRDLPICVVCFNELSDGVCTYDMCPNGWC